MTDDARPLVVDNRLDAADMAEPEVDPDEDLKNPETVMKLLGLPPLTLEIGLDLVPLIDPGVGGDLMERMVPMRVNVASDLGFIMPGVQFRDNLALRPNTYQILVKGDRVAMGEVRPGLALAIPTPAGAETQLGTITRMVSRDDAGAAVKGYTDHVAISGNGRFVAFVTAAPVVAAPANAGQSSSARILIAASASGVVTESNPACSIVPPATVTPSCLGIR